MELLKERKMLLNSIVTGFLNHICKNRHNTVSSGSRGSTSALHLLKKKREWGRET